MRTRGLFRGAIPFVVRASCDDYFSIVEATIACPGITRNGLTLPANADKFVVSAGRG
jgi:hypothetical protein